MRSVSGGFIKDVVASQESQREMMISIARDAWREVLFRSVSLGGVEVGVELECVSGICYLGGTLETGGEMCLG